MKKKTTKEFIEQAITIHGGKYDYSKSNYQGCKKKVCIICPEHGEFWMTPDNHINSKQGCPKCANNVSLTTEIFVERAKLVHNNKYSYNKTNYVNYQTNVIITCPVHGDFEQTPANHLKGEGCYYCGRDKTDNSKRVVLEESIQKASNIHNNYYDYSKVKFDKTIDKVIIICPKHGEFEQIWNNHLRGEGCPKCNRSKGENKVINFLISKNINYVEQYRINIDKEINPSGYAFIDFYLPEYNILIEYNGQQHYIAKDKFGGEIRFQQQLKRDQFVRDYCKNNQIKLIEIMYNENVNDKLIKEL